MSTAIDWSTLTGSKTLADGGYTGDLMTVARAHIDDAIKAGRLTQKEAGQVYSSMIPAAISSAASFILNDALQAAQILGIEQDNLVKAQQVLIAEQDLLLKTKQLELETYRLTNITPAELLQLQKQTDIAEREMIVQETESTAKLGLLAEQTQSENLGQIATIAKVRDENGRNIDMNGNDIVDSSTSTLHWQKIKSMEQEVLKSAQDVAAATKQAAILEIDRNIKKATLESEFGKDVVDTDGVVSYTTKATGTDGGDTASALPTTKFEAEMLKTRVEANIAINTAKGYLADGFYKQAKVLQEMTFGLGNAGVITQDTTMENTTTTKTVDSTSIYARLATAQEKALNGMTGVYGKAVSTDNVTPFIDLDGKDVLGTTSGTLPVGPATTE